MKSDGTPETVMEAWVLEVGLGFAYAITSGEDLTEAQMEALTNSTPTPDENESHRWLMEELVSHTDG